MTGSDLRELESFARDFAWSLGAVGRGRRLSSRDVLEGLVASGLRLSSDDEGVASAALFTSIPEVVRTGHAA